MAETEVAELPQSTQEESMPAPAEQSTSLEPIARVVLTYTGLSRSPFAISRCINGRAFVCVSDCNIPLTSCCPCVLQDQQTLSREGLVGLGTMACLHLPERGEQALSGRVCNLCDQVKPAYLGTCAGQ